MGGQTWGHPKGATNVRLVRLNAGGYDRMGRYWGAGQRLYCVTADEGTGEGYSKPEDGACQYIRAVDRADAVAWVRDCYPEAVVVRP